LVLIILLLTACFWGNASNNNNGTEFNNMSSSVRNSIKFNYDQLFASESGNIIEFSDDFNLPKLRSFWGSEKENITCSLTERPGYLRLKSNKGNSIRTLKLNNTLNKKINKNSEGEVVGYFDMTGIEEGTLTGIYFLEKDVNFIGVEVREGKKILKAEINGKLSERKVISSDGLMLRIRFEKTVCHLEYSIDGLNFAQLGTDLSVENEVDTDNYIGLFCLNETGKGGSVDVDWFYFRPLENSTIQFAETRDNLK
jgi:hypothetical protein